MDTSIVLPPEHELDVRALQGFLLYQVVDGVGVLIGSGEHRKVRAMPLEREFLVKTEGKVEPTWTLQDRRGHEPVDPNPVEVPLRFKGQVGLRDLVVEQLQRYLAVQRANQDPFETLEESQDFELPDGEIDDLFTRAEEQFRQGMAGFRPLNPVPQPGRRRDASRSPQDDDVTVLEPEPGPNPDPEPGVDPGAS